MLAKASRRMVLGLLGMLALGRQARAALQTPEQAAGPFYPDPDQRFDDDDWDLVKIEGHVRQAGGEILHLTGRVLDTAGQPLAGAPVEIWQCDVNGRYLHHGDPQSVPRDADFQGYGRVRTDAEGAYRFRTIRPVPYPGRTPHIHARVGRPDGSVLTTQIYIAGEPGNRQDFLFRRLGRAAQAATSVELGTAVGGDLEAAFDFIV